VKVKFRVGFQPTLKVSSQVRLSDDFAIGRAQELSGNRRNQLGCILIVHHNRVQIMTVPSRYPMVGQIPSLFSRHGRFSGLKRDGCCGFSDCSG
jgi:hypothetical protein